ncbi:hypothetical protein DFH11DRAFT_1505462 [Phellopilus nigrolimitatus]|nr:hypothetical protein DFH11DRAFT_1505462 [Phellopilus nigrolimitatus]
MAAYQNQLLLRLCGKEETLKDAKELLNIAKTKTGPGSGHHLGAGAVGLPAICALLASQRLSNNDVVEQVAQQASCMNSKQFHAALNTVRTALSSYLQKQKARVISYQAFCRDYGLNEDALYWMEEVEKELRKSHAFEELDVDDDTVLYMVFYWTCIALNIRSVKRTTIMSDYGVNLRDFQSLEEVLDTNCQVVRESIDKFVSESRSARSARLSPAKSPSKASTLMKTPTKSTPVARNLANSSPSKRKAHLPPFPSLSPEKRPRVSSPTKLNRLVVTTNQTASTSTPTASPPKKTYGTSSRSFLDSPTKTVSHPAMPLDSLPKRADSPPPPVAPVTPVKARVVRPVVATETTPSPRKSLRISSSVAGPPTPTPKRGRPRRLPSPPPADNDVEMGDPQEADEGSSEDENSPPPPCRHRLPAFSDRLFYHYRDPRVVREWETCEKNMKAMIEKYGNPLGGTMA